MVLRARRRAWGLAIAGVLAGVGVAAGACLPELDEAWLIAGPTILAIELEIVENGPYSTPLADDPPGARRTEGLPGDRLRITPVVVERGGVVDFDDPPILLRCASWCVGLESAELPPCSDEPLVPQLVGACRAAGDELLLPPFGPAAVAMTTWTARWIAARPGSGLDAEACLARTIAEEDASGCLLAELELPYGPERDVFAVKGWPVPDESLSVPNHAAPIDRVELEIDGDAGHRALSVAPGERVALDPGDEVALRIEIPPEAMEEGDDRSVRWYASARVFSGGAELRGLEQRLAAPAEAGSFEVHVVVADRRTSMSWAMLRFDVGPPGGR
ncbi:MAG: hypothetical protein H6710_07890 [Myxococcales bacterium]|nr:hypothetical protein [Myxococcales bacterium]